MFQSKHDGIYVGFYLGKNIKKRFPSSTKRSKGILELIHPYLYGPMLAPSLSCYIYYVLFIYEFSRKSWIYFLKAKSETFNKFQQFKALVGNHIGKHIHALRSNNGGHLKPRDFNDFY